MKKESEKIKLSDNVPTEILDGVKNNLVNKQQARLLKVLGFEASTVYSIMEGTEKIGLPFFFQVKNWLQQEHNLTYKIDDYTTEGKVRFDFSITVLGSQDDNPQGEFIEHYHAESAAINGALSMILLNHKVGTVTASKFIEWLYSDSDDLQTLGGLVKKSLLEEGYISFNVQQLFDEAVYIPTQLITVTNSELFYAIKGRDIHPGNLVFIDDLTTTKHCYKCSTAYTQDPDFCPNCLTALS